MPKQSRGFWICEYCGLPFDSFQEATSHENVECNPQFNRGFDPETTHLHRRHLDSPYPYKHHQPGFYESASMAPYSSTDAEVALDTSTNHEYEGKLGRQFIILPLMGPRELSYLTESDTVACRSLEFFELSGNDFFHGQLGLRCCYCRVDQSRSGDYIVPESTASVGYNVRRISNEHLLTCRAVPSDVAVVLGQRSQRGAAGSSWHEDENDLRALVDFCINRCHQLGVIDKAPGNTGIMLGDIYSQQSEIMQSTNKNQFSRGTAENDSISSHGMKLQPTMEHVRNETLQHPGMSRQQLSAIYEEGDRTYESSMFHSSESNLATAAGTFAGGDHIEPMPLDGHNQMQSVNETLISNPKTHQPANTFDGGSHFPFFQAPNGDWLCRYCSHLHPDYRDQHFIWSTPSKVPPTKSFMDYHLSLCREFNRTTYPYYHGSSPAYSHYIEPSTPPVYAPAQYSWESSRNFPSQAYGTMGRYQDYARRIPAEALGNIIPAPEPLASPALEHGQQLESQLLSVGIEGGDVELATRCAIDHLIATDKSSFDNKGEALTEDAKLVLDEDRLLLTDYFFFLMKQLRLVRFSEADRRTRGGKRENIQVGYGGLQCVHCAEEPNARKFFWSNVDRLANSFAEIPAHVLKCRRCPQATKDALLQLKRRHPEQMARLPRGSQKVFFRRMWRRLHDNDPKDLGPFTLNTDDAPAAGQESVPTGEPAPLDLKPPPTQESPDRTAGSDESILLVERPATEAAKALADSSLLSGPPSPSSRVLLAIPEDKEWLSDTDCFVRRQIEVFCATKDDIRMAKVDRKYSVQEGQVGIRCVHCALAGGARLNAVAFPFSINAMYESVREFQRLHLEECKNVPPAVKLKLSDLKGATSLSSVLRKYYILAANALGLYDTKDGVRAGGESVPFGSRAAFAFSEGRIMGSPGTTMVDTETNPAVGQHNQLQQLKRKATHEPNNLLPSKKITGETN